MEILFNKLGELLGAARFPKLNKLTLCAMDSPQDGSLDILRDSGRYYIWLCAT